MITILGFEVLTTLIFSITSAGYHTYVIQALQKTV
jgi:hypothetical protein